MAFFKAWHDMKSARDRQLSENRALQKALDNLTASNVTGTIDWAVIGSQSQGCHVGVIVSLRNSGAASSIDPASWELAIVTSDRAAHSGYPNTLLDKKLDFCLGSNRAMRFVRNDALDRKTSFNVIPMNGFVQGFLWFGFPSVKRDDALNPLALLRLTAKSITGQNIAIETTIDELQKRSARTKFFPGIENPRPLETPCKENAPY